MEVHACGSSRKIKSSRLFQLQSEFKISWGCMRSCLNQFKKKKKQDKSHGRMDVAHVEYLLATSKALCLIPCNSENRTNRHTGEEKCRPAAFIFCLETAPRQKATQGLGSGGAAARL